MSALQVLDSKSDSLGAVAAVRRTLEWASGDPIRLARTRFLGANCVRLLDPIVASSAVSANEMETLVGIRAYLLTLDELEGAERYEVVSAALAMLGRVVPDERMGARPLSADAVGRLVLPGRRRRQGRGSQNGRDAEGQASGTTRGAASVSGPTDPSPSDTPAASSAAVDTSAPAVGYPSDAPPAPVAVGDAAVEEAAVPIDESIESNTVSTAELDPSSSADAEPEPAEFTENPATDESAQAPPASPSKRVPGEERSSARGGRRRGRGKRERSQPVVAEVVTPPPEPEIPQLPFSHADRGGMPISELIGIDPDLVSDLVAAGFETVGSVLLCPPVRHERAARSGAGGSGPVTLRGKVESRCTRLTPGARRWELVLRAREDLRIVFRWLSDCPRGFATWEHGHDLAFVGEGVESDAGFVVFEAEPVGIDGRGSGALPLYGIDGVDDRDVRDVVAASLTQVLGGVADWMPEAIAERHRLLPLDEALRDAHFPSNAAGRGRARLAFEELLLLQVGVAWKAGRGEPERGYSHKLGHRAVAELGILHGIILTDGQEQAFSEVRRDLLRGSPMTRLIQGDVGAGKGLVTLMAAVMVAEAGGQVAVVSPDGLAAERRFLHVQGLMRSVGVAAHYVSGTPNHAQLDAIRRGEAQVVFGTRTLLADMVKWKRLGLVIVEERGPYGTVLPDSLRGEGTRPDLLVTTRVPIPSSLTFTVFGDFDVSLVPIEDSLRVASRTYNPGARKEAYAMVREHMANGRQAYVVFPVKEDRDLLGIEDGLRMAKALQGEVLSGARIGVYSSFMGREDRTRVFEDFKQRRIDVLVCTTFIEDAPAVANANLMVVEYADMHDLVRLHRLRGHVGHCASQGVCAFVLSDTPAEGSEAVIETISAEKDGFRLAEVDLQIRGAEAVLANRVAEVPSFSWCAPARDRALLLRARAEAFRLLRSDPGLRRSVELVEQVGERWGQWLGRSATPTPKPPADPRRRRRRRRRR